MSYLMKIIIQKNLNISANKLTKKDKSKYAWHPFLPSLLMLYSFHIMIISLQKLAHAVNNRDFLAY